MNAPTLRQTIVKIQVAQSIDYKEEELKLAITAHLKAFFASVEEDDGATTVDELLETYIKDKLK